jgi:hypothetical protein
MKEEFNNIIKSKSLNDISIELVERALDNNITNEIAREIPVIKSVIAVRNIYTSYTDRIFIKKAMNVLLELGETNWKERVELTSDMEDENSSGIEKILIAINHLETIEKCKVFGRLCKLKAVGKIDIDSFKRITKLIQDAYLDDLRLLPQFSKKLKEIENNKAKSLCYNDSYIYMQDYYPLMNLGLIYQEQDEQTPIELVEPESFKDPAPYYRGGEMEMIYYISTLGETFLYYYNDLFS